MRVDNSFGTHFQSAWLQVVLYLISTRLVIAIIASWAASNLSLVNDFAQVLGTSQPAAALAQWDSGYYLKIAAQGYTPQGTEVNFFPGYPIAIWFFAFGHQASFLWAGFWVSNVAFVIAAFLLWTIVANGYGKATAWATILTLSLFPTSFFFSAIYAESLFLLFSVLVYWFSQRRQFLLAAIFVSLASITRIYGVVLVLVPLLELLSSRTPRRSVLAFLTGIASGTGLALYSGFLWLTQGSPLAFLLSQQSEMKRHVTWPGLSLFNSLRVVASGYGGFENNWFMRLTSLYDSLSILLFIGWAVSGIFTLKERSLAAYLIVSVLLLTMSHGPYTLGAYAMSRYVITLFPAFIVGGLLLNRLGQFKWVVWLVSMIVMCIMTAWFATGRWIA